MRFYDPTRYETEKRQRMTNREYTQPEPCMDCGATTKRWYDAIEDDYTCGHCGASWFVVPVGDPNYLSPDWPE